MNRYQAARQIAYMVHNHSIVGKNEGSTKIGRCIKCGLVFIVPFRGKASGPAITTKCEGKKE